MVSHSYWLIWGKRRVFCTVLQPKKNKRQKETNDKESADLARFYFKYWKILFFHLIWMRGMFLHTETSQLIFFSLPEDQNKVILNHQLHMKGEGPAECLLFFLSACAWCTFLLLVQKPAALSCSLPAVCWLSASTKSIPKQRWAAPSPPTLQTQSPTAPDNISLLNFLPWFLAGWKDL